MKIVHTTAKDFRVWMRGFIEMCEINELRIDYKIMKDESGKTIVVYLIHDDRVNSYYDKVKLIIKYSDNSEARIYEPTHFLNPKVFLIKDDNEFNYMYEKCKENDYFKYIMEDK